jgi:hypothetical protein
MLRWLYATVGWLVLVGLGFGLLLLALEPSNAPQALLYEIENFMAPFMRAKSVPLVVTAACYVSGAALLMIAALSLAAPLGRARRPRLLEFPTESGRVQVDISALEQCLARVVSEQEGVVRARVQLRGGVAGGATPLGCTATIWFEAGPDVIGRVSEIQSRMRAYYYQVLPVKDPVKIDVRTKLVYHKPGSGSDEARPVHPGPSPDPGPLSSESSRLAAPAQEDYSGPRYPTDGNEDPGAAKDRP